MAKKTGTLVRTGLAIAATALAEAAVQQVAQDPRVQRKAREIATATGRALKRTVKKVTGKRGGKTRTSRRTAARRKK